ncbi:MAG: cytochrome c [Bacteroidetes bacterium]|nr:cytochrome c [Bacteroidota bacterium]
MAKVLVFITLIICFILYSIVIYTTGTIDHSKVSTTEYVSIQKGKMLFQKNNCTACHQIYGLGGYLGPELTTAFSDSLRGEQYMRAFLKSGGARMPNFHFTSEEIDNIIAYLKYIDGTATTYKNDIKQP